MIEVSQSAFIKLVQGSVDFDLTTAAIQSKLKQYCDQAARTGEQLGWNYADAAFPYTIVESEDERWFYLKGATAHYNHIIMGIGNAECSHGNTVPCIQVVLPKTATHGDKGKANEYSKYMAKQLQAELTLFNGRTIYYNPRK